MGLIDTTNSSPIPEWTKNKKSHRTISDVQDICSRGTISDVRRLKDKTGKTWMSKMFIMWDSHVQAQADLLRFRQPGNLKDKHSLLKDDAWNHLPPCDSHWID